MLTKKIYGLIGKNIEYSFSRNYFNNKFEKFRIRDTEYKNFDLSDISEFEKIDLSNIVGFNVTIPYKEDIITFIDKISDDALKIGAVNTIKISNNKLIGFNTDHIGFSKSLNGKKFKNALVFGSGGASKAIKYSLNNLGIRFNIVSRKKAPGLISYENLNKEIMNSDLIINTTPLGTFP